MFHGYGPIYFKTNMASHRYIWKKFFGEIPKDENGRSYEIHHINGNRFDNRIENLKCVSIQEHFDIHLAQGDYGAAFRIAQRLDIEPEEKSKLMSLSNKKRIEEGTHSFLRPELRQHNKEKILDRVKKKIQGFQNKEVIEKAVKAKKLKYTSEQLSEQVKKGWDMWKQKNIDVTSRTLQGSKAGAEKTKGTKWYHKEDGTHLRTNPSDPRIVTQEWKPGRFNGKELSKKANLSKLSKNNKNK